MLLFELPPKGLGEIIGWSATAFVMATLSNIIKISRKSFSVFGNRERFMRLLVENTWALSTVFPPSGGPKKYRGGVGRRKPCFLLIVHILYKYNNQDCRIWGEFDVALPRIIRYRFAFQLVIRLRKSFFFSVWCTWCKVILSVDIQTVSPLFLRKFF